MPELKMISPLLSNMEVVECVNSHAGLSSYIVRSTKTQTTYLLKHISIPESQRQIDALIYSGAAKTKEDAQKYYEQVVSDYKQELEMLEMLSISSNIESFHSYQIQPKENGIGFELYLLAENRTTLKDHLERTSVSKLFAVNLALDLCNALIDLREAGLIHRNIKPSNVYLNKQEHFVIGDLGLAKIDELKFASIPERMISSYSAPELFNLVGNIDQTIDIYSVGLILYRIFNGNHGPFEDEKTSAKSADRRRVTGEDLPAPMYADYEMSEIILKACAFSPDDRYQTPAEFRDELIEYVKRNQLDDTMIVPPIVSDEEEIITEEEVEPVQFADTDEMTDDFKESFSPDTAMLNSIIESIHRDLDREEERQEPEQTQEEVQVKPKRKNKASRWGATVLCAVILFAVAAALVYFLVIAPSTIHINHIRFISADSTSLTVSVDSFEDDGEFVVVCSDAYGNTFRQAYFKGENVSFTDLAPGTQYTITVDPFDDKKVTGNAVCHASTMEQTQILSFDVKPVNLTQVSLNIALNGPEPPEWTVSYYPGDKSAAQTATFSGHSVTIADLQPDMEYTFELLQTEEIVLTGTLSATYSTKPTVNIDKTTVALSSTSAMLSWTIIGEEPEFWTVKVSSKDGYDEEYTVNSPAVTLEGLTSGVEYEVIISAPTMLQDGYLTVTPTVISVSDLTVTEQDDGWLVSWKSSEDADSSNWTLYCTPKGSDKSAGLAIQIENTDEYLIESKELLPNTTYTLSLELANGDVLDGDTNSEITTAEYQNFHTYGFESGYIGLYHKPDKEEWSAVDLASATMKFQSGENVAFAIQGIGILQQSEDEVEVRYVVKDAQGVIVSSENRTLIWNEMWKGDLFVDALTRTPTVSGDYDLQIFFNGKYVVKSSFEIL